MNNNKELNSSKILQQKIFKHIYTRVVIKKKLIKEGTYLKYLKHCEQVNKEKGVSSFEKHHVIPRAAGGSDNTSNIIMLSTRQHILAHLIRYLEKGENCDKTAYIFRKATKHHNPKTHGQKMAMLNKIQGTGFYDSKIQSELGKRGGPKGVLQIR